MSHYKANLRDIEFCLFDLLGRDKVMGIAPYDEVDRDTSMGMLEEMKRLCENDLAASFVEGDRVGAILNKETGNVTLPESFKKSYKAYVDGEWWRVDAPVELGGMKIPPSVRWAIAEMVLGSNPAIHIYASGYAFAQVAYVLGTEEQKKIAKLMVDKHWGATMQLTEPMQVQMLELVAQRLFSKQMERGTSPEQSVTSLQVMLISMTTLSTSYLLVAKAAGQVPRVFHYS